MRRKDARRIAISGQSDLSLSGGFARYKLRLRRKRLLWRAFRKRKELVSVSRNTEKIRPSDILLFATVRNEMLRLPYFLSHYRRMGVAHFLIVDNSSDDGSDALLASQPDVSLWTTAASYKKARFGLDWLTCLQWRYGHGHWTLTVDADELFIYPAWQRVDLPEVTALLARAGLGAMGATLLDMYPKGPIEAQNYAPGEDPIGTLPWFDAHGCWAQLQPKLGNLWLQGGPRARMFFADDPARAPTLNKIPLVRWDSTFVYVNSTHNALPRHLNQVYDAKGVEKPWGALLHTKFLPDAGRRARIEKQRSEHFADPKRYADYYDALVENPDFWTPQSERFESAEQLERLGIMSKGNLKL